MTYTITPLIAEDAICERVRELAASIDRAMAGKPYILLLLLNGALPFAAMLEKHLKSRPVVKAVKISSYAGMRNSGSVVWEGIAGLSSPMCLFWWWMTFWIRALRWMKFAGN
ncbi:hypothetical protein M5E88_17685 [Akkermansia muciniphila]|nr:hypothetical protein M5E88_17685 [Akkermansia muciniphila]